MARLIADFDNVHRGEGAGEIRPVDVLPWIDPYADDESFFASMRAIARELQPQEVSWQSSES